jgi:transcriptional regulator
MHIPKHHEMTDLATLQSLLRSRPLGTWVLQTDNELLANHVPFLLDAARGPYGTLCAHVARTNPVWQVLNKSVVVFHGVDGYVTPSWYPSKQATGKAVPTWNYVVVHAHGTPRAIEDPHWLLNHLTQLTNTHEAGNALPWKVSDAPSEYIERLLSAIVGIEIPIDRLVGKWKVSQNRPEADKRGVVEGLLERADEHSRAMAAMVDQFIATKRV